MGLIRDMKQSATDTGTGAAIAIAIVAVYGILWGIFHLFGVDLNVIVGKVLEFLWNVLTWLWNGGEYIYHRIFK